ncbi:MAG TPA: diacylglycerol kinase family protein [Anaerolineaceae bacterium]|nr:diacylglycerol kinase family protein [Anaerolineaceae bacterium]
METKETNSNETVQKTVIRRYRNKKVKLIFNPKAGVAKPEVASLEEIIDLMHKYHFEPEVFIIEPDADLASNIKKALADGFDLFVACGGDGTSSSTARLLAGTGATLGIIPLGTQNNTALAYDIPADAHEAIRILREGRKLKVDLGQATVAGKTTNFVELCSVGLVSDLFPLADDIQHGNLFKTGELLKSLANEKPSNFEISLDTRKKPIVSTGYVLLVANMPVFGFNFRVGKRSAMQDGKLDVYFFKDASKLELLSYVFRGMEGGLPQEKNILHILAKKVSVRVDPKMAIMYDDQPFGEGDVELSILKHALTVMIPKNSRIKQII